MNFLPHTIIKHQLYLLQLENYQLKRFWHVFIRQGFRAKQMRQELVWTNKLKAVFGIAIIIQSAVIIFALLAILANIKTLPTGALLLVLAIYATSLLFGIWAILAVIIIWPLDYVLKNKIIKQAKNKLKSREINPASKKDGVKIIGIAGSYGKTTMKEALAGILSQKHKVLKTADNQNTPLGIARLIIEELDDTIEVLIVEMGAYQRGDIKKLCDIAKPDISVLTGINESHLERFGGLDNTIKAKFEIIKHAKPDAKIILNIDDDVARENYQDYAGGKEIFFYSAANHIKCDYKVVDKQFLADGSGQSANIAGGKENIGPIKTKFLGDYIFGGIIAGIIIARELALTTEQIRHGISRLEPVKHRLQVIKGAAGVTVIDDSYNGNPDGARAAIKVLNNFKNKRKIYITPGLAETGEKTKDVHLEIGRELAKTADKVVLIKNSATPHLEQGLLKNGFKKENIIWFNSAKKAHESMPEIIKAGDAVLFQNDWPDNYL